MGILQGVSSFGIIRSNTTPFWLWWNLLSLDAPTVAIIWALVFARAYQMTLSNAEVISLLCAVWVVYTSDRLMDGWRGRNRAEFQERHRFCSRHRGMLACLLTLAVVTGFVAATRYLARSEFIAAITLAAVICTYMAGVHIGDGWLIRIVQKEAAVGLLFTAGVTLPLWSHHVTFSWAAWASFALFAMLCSLNCLAIECWEAGELPSNTAHHPALKWANGRLAWMAAAVAVSAISVLPPMRANGFKGNELYGISLTALLIMLINLHRDRFSSSALRVLADAALVVAGLLVLITEH
jgi:hypothetical protein